MRILTCDDSNENQSIRVHTPNRSYPLDVVPIPASALPMAGASGSARATDATNTVPAAVGTFLETTGNAFVQVNGSADWTFNPNACFWTYTGPPGKRFLFTLVASLDTTTPGNLFVAIDADQTIVLTPAATNFTESVATLTHNNAGSVPRLLTTTRLIAGLINGAVVQPVFAHSGNAVLTILRLSFSFAEVGPG